MTFTLKFFTVLLFFFNLINFDIVIAKTDRDILEQCRYIFDRNRKNSIHLSDKDDAIMEQECNKNMDLIKEALQIGSILGYASGLKEAGISDSVIKQKTDDILRNYPSVFGICHYSAEGNSSDPAASGFNEKEIRRFYNYLKDQSENSKKPISYLYVELMRTVFPLDSDLCRSKK